MNLQPIAAVLNIAIAVLVIYKLFFCFHYFNMCERFGLGMIGAGALMTIPPLVTEETGADWAVVIFRLGLVVYLVGRILARHAFPPTLRWRRPT